MICEERLTVMLELLVTDAGDVADLVERGRPSPTMPSIVASCSTI